jgi:hypothetical protein
MLWSNRSATIAGILFAGALTVFGPAAPAVEGGGGDGGGSGGAGKAEGQQAAPVSREFIEYSKKSAQLNSLKSRIDEANEKFAGKLAAKNATRDTKRQQNFAEEMAAIAKERNKHVTEYTALRQELKYRYPNKGEEIDKRFVPTKEKSAEELEASAEIDVLLTGIKRRLDKKYAPFMPKEEEEAKPIVTAPPRGGEEPLKKKLRLVK